MSKIYEALLRAEIERIAGQSTRGEAPAGPFAADAAAQDETAAAGSTNLLAIPFAPSSKAEANGAPPSALHATSLQATAATKATAGTADFTPTPVMWSPDRRRLPALDPRGAEVEQIRGLRARVHDLRFQNPALKVLQISSGMSGEGKSFIAANLAVSLASYKNNRVLLIDGDMRRGTLHKLLGTFSEPGLSVYLAGNDDLGSIIQTPVASVIASPEMEGLAALSFIAYGRSAENAADLSGNGRFRQLLDRVRDAYDWIVVDSSPVNLVADGVNMARAVDGVLLVTRAGITKLEVAQRALADLQHANVLGVVLNAVTDKKPAGGYYGY